MNRSDVILYYSLMQNDPLLTELRRRSDDFDWVAERANCSAVAMFEKLRMHVEQDILSANKHRKTDTAMFRLVDGGATRFSVLGEALGINTTTVRFLLQNEEIVVTDREGKASLRASVTFCNDGECRLKVAGQECEFWQFRKMSLEDLFFL